MKCLQCTLLNKVGASRVWYQIAISRYSWLRLQTKSRPFTAMLISHLTHWRRNEMFIFVYNSHYPKESTSFSWFFPFPIPWLVESVQTLQRNKLLHITNMSQSQSTATPSTFSKSSTSSPSATGEVVGDQELGCGLSETDKPENLERNSREMRANDYHFPKIDMGKYVLHPRNQSLVHDFSDPILVHTNTAEAMLRRGMRNIFGGISPSISDIIEINYVENKALEGKFKAKKEQFQAQNRDTGELLLFHGTNYASTHSICENNFNLEVLGRSLHGRGIYFSRWELNDYARD